MFITLNFTQCNDVLFIYPFSQTTECLCVLIASLTNNINIRCLYSLILYSIGNLLNVEWFGKWLAISLISNLFTAAMLNKICIPQIFLFLQMSHSRVKPFVHIKLNVRNNFELIGHLLYRTEEDL